MSIQAVAWALDQEIPQASVKLVLICICNHADRVTGTGYPPIGTLAREASMSERSVQRQLQKLLDYGLITSDKVFDHLTGRQMANTYRVVFDEAEQAALGTSRESASPGDRLTPSPDDNLSPSPAVENLVYHGGTTDPDQPAAVTLPPDSAVTPGGDNGVTPKRNLHKKPSEETFGRESEQAREAFEQLWRSHPAANRPTDRRAAELMFERLDAHDRTLAIQYHGDWMRRTVALEQALSIPHYFRSKAWRELENAPAFDPKGYFKITPTRPEWKPWLASIEARHGERGIETTRRLGYYLTKERWPDGHVVESKQIGIGI